MKVLHCTATHGIGGVPVYIDELVRTQVDQGWEPIVACPKGGDLANRIPTGVQQIDWPRSSAPHHLALAAVQLVRLIDDVRPDVMHLHASVAGALGRMVRRRGVAVVFQPHAWSFYSVPPRLDQPTRLLERVLARRAATVVCGSPGEAVAGRTAGIVNTEVVNNAVAVDRFRPASTRDRAKLRSHFGIETPYTVVSVGRLEQQKNPHMLLDAWRLADREDATLLLVGDGHLRAGLEDRLPNNTTMVGAMADPLSAHQVADITLLASNYETRSLSVLEAMACGSPVIATDVSGTEHLADGRAGTLVPIGGAADMAVAITDWLDDPERLEGGRTTARLTVEENFDQAVWASEMTAMYERLVPAAKLTDVATATR